ncbi:DnaJ-domain-containing protein [Polychaeton citri CBS 116435]|uniref:DnaJ-domain-containing protein n=1 Tax=Polychaeton citri CBS 116435 TaxID=1314669 RepID=A0A9P4QEG8_9PEZI|nr:DnaJ-domain-containing protein [Polychaeton citri CBS 116435]
MGAGQSSTSEPQSQGDVKTSYYVLLGIDRDATEEQIKKAYRRKALELHPDRNFGNEEDATKTFAEIQAAYQVLSDPQERAWYDSHESTILRGDDGEGGEVPQYQGDVKVTTAEDLARIIAKFNSRIEFNDGPSGFFGFLREIFEHLAKEEEVAADWENVDVLDYPTFGHKDDEYEDVVKQFYATWSSFSTMKTFAWKDKYRLSEAPDRRYRRAMEKENQRARQDGKNEFNEAVRSFVAFVRKRDPRYVPTTQSEAERQKALRDAADAQRRRAQQANAELIKDDAVPEWAKFREPEEMEEEQEEEQDQEVFECVACDKIFKSEKQILAHEKSKKHQKAVQALKRKMKKDDANLDLEGEVFMPHQDNDDLSAEGEELDTEQVDVARESEDRIAPVNPELHSKDEGNLESESDGGDGDTNANVAAGPNKEPLQRKSSESELDSGEDSDYASPDTITSRLQPITIGDGSPGDTANRTPDDEASNSDSVKPKMGKAAQKRAKRAAAAASVHPQDLSHTCVGCDAAFPSKTRLFQHIKDHPKHAALKPSIAAAGGKGKKKGKK